MIEEEVLTKLENLLRDLAIQIRYENGDFSGGLCRYDAKKQVIINKAHSMRKKIAIIVNELKTNVDLDNLYIVPALREVIEHADRLE